MIASFTPESLAKKNQYWLTYTFTINASSGICLNSVKKWKQLFEVGPTISLHDNFNWKFALQVLSPKNWHKKNGYS